MTATATATETRLGASRAEPSRGKARGGGGVPGPRRGARAGRGRCTGVCPSPAIAVGVGRPVGRRVSPRRVRTESPSLKPRAGGPPLRTLLPAPNLLSGREKVRPVRRCAPRDRRGTPRWSAQKGAPQVRPDHRPSVTADDLNCIKRRGCPVIEVALCRSQFSDQTTISYLLPFRTLGLRSFVVRMEDGVKRVLWDRLRRMTLCRTTLLFSKPQVVHLRVEICG